MERKFRLSLVFALAFSAVLAHATPLRVGVYQNKPKIFIDTDGHARGILIDLLENIARLENWQLEYVRCKWSACLKKLSAGQIDLMPDVAWNEDRARQFSFGKVAALNSWLQIYSRPGENLKSVLDLKDKKIAVMENSVEATVLRQIRDGFGIDFTSYRVASFADAFHAVESGKADVVLTNNYYGDYHLGKYDVQQTPIMFHPSRLYFATTRGRNKEVLAAIDRHLANWKSEPDSIYYRTIARWVGGPAHIVVPAYLKWAITIILGLLVLTLIGTVALRRQVALRTRDLQERNVNLAQALDELARSRERAVEQERLHALGRMASGIAHDFNNSLMLMLGHVELLRAAITNGNETRDQLVEQLRLIEDAGQDAGQIVKRMRDFYRNRQEDEPREPILLDQLAKDVIELARPRWETQARSEGVRFDVVRELHPVAAFMGRRSEIREALLNLVLNALDAMKTGGRLSVFTGQDEAHVFVEIRDTGCGMSKEIVEHCLRPFYSTKKGAGTGMGLSMVASMVERYDGQIDIESREGEGSNFKLVFSLDTRSHAAAGEGG